jgi:hypothetical protein
VTLGRQQLSAVRPGQCRAAAAPGVRQPA